MTLTYFPTAAESSVPNNTHSLFQPWCLSCFWHVILSKNEKVGPWSVLVSWESDLVSRSPKWLQMTKTYHIAKIMTTYARWKWLNSAWFLTHAIFTSWKDVTIPSWGPPTTRTEKQEGYDKEELLCMHVMSDKEEQESYEPEQDSWQISCLVSTDAFNVGHDTGNVRTERMKIMWQPPACGLYSG